MKHALTRPILPQSRSPQSLILTSHHTRHFDSEGSKVREATLDCIIVLVVESIHLNCFIYFHFFIKIPEVLGLFALYLSVFVLIKKCIHFIVIFIYITFC